MSFFAPDPDKYYTFVRTLVGRYKNVIHYWEVWNEPDNAMFWKPAPDPAAYAIILKTAYRAVKGRRTQPPRLLPAGYQATRSHSWSRLFREMLQTHSTYWRFTLMPFRSIWIRAARKAGRKYIRCSMLS